MNLDDIIFLWLPLSAMKCSGVHFTHICEWKRCSPSSSSSDSSRSFFPISMVVLGFSSMIHFACFELEFDLGSDYVSSLLANNDYFKRNSSVLCQGILWNSHHFPVSFFVSSLPLFYCVLDYFY
jgi:hypothetical protein